MRSRLKYSKVFSLFALTVSTRLYMTALAFAPLEDSIKTKFFLIDAVCKSFADGTVLGYLGIFLFCTLIVLLKLVELHRYMTYKRRKIYKTLNF